MELKQMKMFEVDLIFVIEKLISYLNDEQLEDYNAWIKKENEKVLEVLKAEEGS